MAQTGLWKLAKEKTMKERGDLPHEEGDVVRAHKAMHEDEKSKEERKAEAEGKEKKKEKRGKERRRKKRMKR